MSSEIHIAQQVETDIQAQRLEALRRVEEAMEGTKAEREAAQAELARLTTPQQQIHESIIEVLPRAVAPKSREFTGAPRRVTLTSGRLSHDGGAHRHQKLYR